MKIREFEITENDFDVNFAPKNEVEEILQNVRTILSTPKGTRPMDRDFGINPFVPDKPFIKEQARIHQEVVDAIKKYEPRAKIIEIGESISKKTAMVCPRVVIAIEDNEE